MAEFNPLHKHYKYDEDDKKKRRPWLIVLLWFFIVLFVAAAVCTAVYFCVINVSEEPSAPGTGYYYELNDADGNDIVGRTDITVFNNNSFSEDKIAPGASGEYTFNFENVGDNAMTYSLTFSCENEYNINIVYKLKCGSKYVCGDEDTYVSIADLKVEDRVVRRGRTDVYTLYWTWAHNDAVDTVAGINSASYTLTMNVTAMGR
ncbi:MAG: hypothetical protein LUD27_03540 [Clostridia bacterium]|nr:hypothetical protein [Clostridia bacterium]